MSIDPENFKEILSRYASGVTIVTTVFDKKDYGLTVTSFCSVSISPPLVLICVDKSTNGYQALLQAEEFTVNLLSLEQADLSEKFGGADIEIPDRFSGESFLRNQAGHAFFEDGIGYISCRKWNIYDGGDHGIVVGEVKSTKIYNDNPPLIHLRRNYGTFNPS